jgi:alkaline phosphatase D
LAATDQLAGGRASRRTVLRAGLAAGALLALPGCVTSASGRGSGGRGSPFTLGVASGEPAPDGVVLWTRLAIDPLAEDGLGGLGTGRHDVEWELATDERFARVEQRGEVSTGPEVGHSVHVELGGLQPGHEYHYRFRALGELSPAGRTRTAPAPDASAPLTMCFASCAQYEHGYFTAYTRIAEEEPDLVLHLGDYLYEEDPGAYKLPGGSVRQHVGRETVTLADYRRRHAQYRSDTDLQAAHAVAPWVVVWDDHEVEDDWAGFTRDVPEYPPGPFPPRRAAAFQAYWENMPLRSAQRPNGQNLQLYRRIGWGATATFHMLDTRQYRDDQACGEQLDCAARTDPARSLPGSAQERWLAEGLRGSRTRWDVLGQQVFFAQLDLVPGAGRGFNNDVWDGYPASRDRVVDSWVAAGIRNPVVLTGDIHSHWAADIRRRWDDPEAPTVGTELVTSSISAGGDGSETTDTSPGLLAENPHIRFFNNRRGYVRTRFTDTELTADFRVLPHVQRPGAPAETRATFVIEDRRPGLQSA